MTDYFEIHERDGAARLGELRLADPVTTPALADPFLADAGSLWAAERTVPDGDEASLTVLPHRAFPGNPRRGPRVVRGRSPRGRLPRRGGRRQRERPPRGR